MGTFQSRVYVDGALVTSADDLVDSCKQRKEHGGLSILLLDSPDQEQMTRLAEEFGLHAMAVEDALEAHQRAKFDRYGDTAFVVLRPARYLDEPELVEVGELHLFVGPDFAVIVRHEHAPDLSPIAERMDAEPWLTGRGGLGVLYAALDLVVDGYFPVLDGLENDVDEIEDQVFSGEPAVAKRIYQLSREAIGLQRAVHPLPQVLRRAGLAVDHHLTQQMTEQTNQQGHDEHHVMDLAPDELRAGLADVWDHVGAVTERVDALREVLSDILDTNSTLVTLDQNTRMATLAEEQYDQDQQVKKISSWAAVFLAPTLLAGIWGMNFAAMPELDWRFGYPAALLTMLVISGGLYARFRRIGWL